MKTINPVDRFIGHIMSSLFGIGVILWMIWVSGGFGPSSLTPGGTGATVFSNACIVFAIATIAWSLRSWWIIRRLSR